MNALKLNAHPNTPLLVSPPPPGTRIPEERERETERERESNREQKRATRSSHKAGERIQQHRSSRILQKTMTNHDPNNTHFTNQPTLHYHLPKSDRPYNPGDFPSLFSTAPRISGIINPAFGSSWFSDYSYLIYCESNQIQPKWLLMMLSIWRRRYSRALNSILKWYFR